MSELKTRPDAVHWSKKLPFDLVLPLRFKEPFDGGERRKLMLDMVNAFRQKKKSLGWDEERAKAAGATRSELVHLKWALSMTLTMESCRVIEEVGDRILLKVSMAFNLDRLKKKLDQSFERAGLKRDEAVLFVADPELGLAKGTNGIALGPFAFVTFNWSNEIFEDSFLASAGHEFRHVQQHYTRDMNILYAEALALIFENRPDREFKLNVLGRAGDHLGFKSEREGDAEKIAIVNKALGEQLNDLRNLYSDLRAKIGEPAAQELLLNCGDFDEAIAACLERIY